MPVAPTDSSQGPVDSSRAIARSRLMPSTVNNRPEVVVPGAASTIGELLQLIHQTRQMPSATTSKSGTPDQGRTPAGAAADRGRCRRQGRSGPCRLGATPTPPADHPAPGKAASSNQVRWGIGGRAGQWPDHPGFDALCSPAACGRKPTPSPRQLIEQCPGGGGTATGTLRRSTRQTCDHRRRHQAVVY